MSSGTMKLGKHVSIAGGIDRAPARARELGCNCLQIFPKNPRGWKGRQLKPGEAERVKDKLLELEMSPLVVHDTYLINPASPKDELWEKSRQGLQFDYRRSGEIGADYLVVHPGNHTGAGNKAGIERAARALNWVLSRVDSRTTLLLENVAGRGTAIGSNFAELYDIINSIEHKQRVGICFDTCHGFAAGYDVSSQEGINGLLEDFQKYFKLERLKVIHINDSQHPLGSHKDEHAHIGEGYIGERGFAGLINHPLLKQLPFILETPRFEGEDQDVKKLLELRKD